MPSVCDRGANLVGSSAEVGGRGPLCFDLLLTVPFLPTGCVAL
jgi:hypothetical protein